MLLNDFLRWSCWLGIAKSKFFVSASFLKGRENFNEAERLETQTLERLKQMLNVRIDKLEDRGEEILIYVPKDQIARAIGAGGSVVKSAELTLKRKLTVKESIVT